MDDLTLLLPDAAEVLSRAAGDLDGDGVVTLAGTLEVLAANMPLSLARAPA